MKKYRKAVFIVTYSIEKNKIHYLILKRKLHWKGWEFPKGGLEKGEGRINAVKRETKEETNLIPIKIKKFNFSGKYNYAKKYLDRPEFDGQSYSLYSVEVKKNGIKVDKREHSDYKWVEFDKAVEKLTWSNQKKSLKMVHNWLQNDRRSNIDS